MVIKCFTWIRMVSISVVVGVDIVWYWPIFNTRRDEQQAANIPYFVTPITLIKTQTFVGYEPNFNTMQTKIYQYNDSSRKYMFYYHHYFIVWVVNSKYSWFVKNESCNFNSTTLHLYSCWKANMYTLHICILLSHYMNVSNRRFNIHSTYTDRKTLKWRTPEHVFLEIQ